MESNTILLIESKFRLGGYHCITQNKKEKKIKEGKVNIGRYNCIHDKVVLYQI